VYGEYLPAALTNYDEKDMRACNMTNKEVPVCWQGIDLHTWYSRKEPKAWDEEVTRFNINTEEVFRPMQPSRKDRQMFGYALYTNLRVAGALVMDQ
jgi:hypothetical protein